MTRVQFLVGGFMAVSSLFHCVHATSGAHPALYPTGTVWALTQGAERPGREAV